MKSGPQKTVTSIDVAKYAGVSQSTVSRAFSGNGKLSEDTLNRVLEAARALNYHPNAFARSLVSSQSKFIGIIGASSSNPVFSELLTLIMRQLQNTEYQVIYYEVSRTQSIDDIIARVLQYRVDGIIMLYSALSSKVTQSCRERGIPVLQMQRYSTNAQANVVTPANHEGACMAVDHLVSKGYKTFAYITGEMNSSSNLERQSGFISRVAELGFDSPIVLPGDYTYESGAAAMPLLMQQATLPCGVLCGNDLMAMGLIDACRRCNVRIPEDLGVVGFDNNFMGNWPVYQITSLEQPSEDLVKHGVSLLLRKIDTNDLSPDITQLSFRLIERRSTQRIP